MRLREALWLSEPSEPPEFRAKPILFVPWALTLITAFRDAAVLSWPGRVVALAGLAGFVVLYILAVHLGLSEEPDRQWRAVLLGTVLLVLAVALMTAFGGNMIRLFFLLAVVFGLVLLPTRLWFGPSVILAVALLAAALDWARNGDNPLSVLLTTVLFGMVTHGFLRLVAAIAELREAREELAHAAVVEERLRFSRDLHDLLGHTMSVVVVKAEAVRRLAVRSPELAASHAADIESIGRQALVEIREAVSGYRQRSAAQELAGARAVLGDAGIEATVRQHGTPLPEAVDTLLAWAIREGVTNVIRHSRATRCEIGLRGVGGDAVLEIDDDGTGVPSAAHTGTGLRGLTERAAAAGGAVSATASPLGGFRLTVTLPVAASEGDG